LLLSQKNKGSLRTVVLATWNAVKCKTWKQHTLTVVNLFQKLVLQFINRDKNTIPLQRHNTESHESAHIGVAFVLAGSWMKLIKMDETLLDLEFIFRSWQAVLIPDEGELQLRCCMRHTPIIV